MPNPLQKFLKDKKVMIFLGPGGVGKTTSSIGMAVYAAMQGKKVGLLSIDPAKRLASALGLDFHGTPTKVHFEKPLKGSLEASMLDQKAVFDRMVQRHAPSEDVADKILEHPLYKAASMHLAGSLEYMALARLQEMMESEDYDLIVLDTPPDTHALDFLSRPDVLSRFREQKVMNWLIKPFLLAAKFGLGRLLNMGEKLMGGVAQVTGLKALRSFAEFLVLIQQVIDGFHFASEGILKTLHAESTAFCLVTVPTFSGYRTGLSLGQRLKELGYPLSGLCLNRVFMKELGEEIPDFGDVQEELLSPEQNFLYKLWQRKMNEKTIKEDLIRELIGPSQKETFFLEIEEKKDPIHKLDSVYDFASSLER